MRCRRFPLRSAAAGRSRGSRPAASSSSKKPNDVIGDLLAHGVGRAGRPTRASLIRFDDGDNLGGINHGVVSTDPVKGVSDGDGLAMRRQRKDEDIAEFPDCALGDGG